MELLDESDRDGHLRTKNLNHFALLYESDDEEVTQHRTKLNTPIIVPSKKEKGEKK